MTVDIQTLTVELNPTDPQPSLTHLELAPMNERLKQVGAKKATSPAPRDTAPLRTADFLVLVAGGSMAAGALAWLVNAVVVGLRGVL